MMLPLPSPGTLTSPTSPPEGRSVIQARFENKTVLVTGASSGIGLAVAQRLSREGARIVGVARDSERLQAVLVPLPGEGHQACAADAADWDQIKPLIKVGKEAGGFAGAVLCAGAHELLPLALLDGEHLRRSFDANVTAAVNGIKLMAKAAAKEGAGIVLLSSVAALRGSPGFLAYAAAKGALLSTAKTAATELAGRRIRVNTIVGGVVETPMSQTWLGRLDEAQRRQVETNHLLGFGLPDDIAGVAAFLLSDDARWVTGAEIAVDGGLSAH